MREYLSVYKMLLKVRQKFFFFGFLNVNYQTFLSTHSVFYVLALKRIYLKRIFFKDSLSQVKFII